jgi:hypothetical protein
VAQRLAEQQLAELMVDVAGWRSDAPPPQLKIYRGAQREKE